MTKDQFIVEALGGCWLVGHPYINHKLDTPEGFFWLWERFQKHERWWEFLNKHGWVAVGSPAYPDSFLIDIDLINPLHFRDITAEFFGWKEEK